MFPVCLVYNPNNIMLIITIFLFVKIFNMFQFFVCFLALTFAQVNAHLDIEVRKYEYCPDHPDPAIKHHANFKKINATHIQAGGDSSVPYDLGEDVTVNLKIDMKKDGEWKEFKTLEDKDPCKLFNKYGGDMWMDLEQEVGIARGACPLPKGDYKVENHLLDFEKLPIKTGPKADFRAKFQMIKGSEVILCLDIEVESL